MSRLNELAGLIQQRNAVDKHIASLIGRPPHSGHIAEYVAAAIFRIALHPSAATRASDGYFLDGPLQGRSVNIKYGSRRDGLLNLVHSLEPANHPDYYLVLTGPPVGAISSVGLDAPWVIRAVYLFESGSLLATLASLGRKPGTATSLRRHLWDSAMVFPEPRSEVLHLTDEQFDSLSLFHGTDEPVPAQEAATSLA